ncbi:V-type ATP synthase beta chain [Dirofilaria immitis]
MESFERGEQLPDPHYSPHTTCASLISNQSLVARFKMLFDLATTMGLINKQANHFSDRSQHSIYFFSVR